MNPISRCLLQCLRNVDQKTFRYLSTIRSSAKLSLTMKKLISAGQSKKALDLLDRELPIYTDVIYTLALKACANLSDYQRGVRIHQQLSSKSLQDPFIQTSLIHFYMQCHRVDHADRIFSRIPKKTIFMYGAMFKGYISNEMPEKVLELYDKICVKADEVLMMILFNACAKLANAYAIELGQNALSQLPMSFLRHQKLVNAAIDMLMKFGDMQHAERLFEQLTNKSLVSYGAMMQGYSLVADLPCQSFVLGYVRNNCFEKALDVLEVISARSNEVLYAIGYHACASLCNERAIQFGKKLVHQMPKRFFDDLVVMNSVIHMWMKFSELENAEDLFSQMKTRNVYSYGIMINGYSINHQADQSLALFEQMKKENIKINGAISLALINACAQIGIRSVSERILHQITDVQDNLQLKNSLINMWGKSSDIHRAKEIFQSIPQPDSISYNSIINAYGRNGMGYEAIDLYQTMPENFRDGISHICVLNACSHSGLIDQAQEIFSKIPRKTGDIVTTMIDCLGRMGMYDQAEQMINDYDQSHSASLIMYTALLSAARNHRQVALSQKLYDRMKSLFPDQKSDMTVASILLSNIYSALGDDQQAEKIRLDRIKQFGNKVQVGSTWTEVNGQLVKFYAHDRSHPQSAEIYAELRRLSEELKEHGHHYDPSWVTRPLGDGETIESVLSGHSEKLAIVYNLIQHPRPTFIQLTNDLRVCGDCHAATKIIAKIRRVEIVVRDANRIHHFYPTGQCSCQDHF